MKSSAPIILAALIVRSPLALALGCLLTGAALWRVWSIKLVLDDTHIQVQNFWRNARKPWSEVKEVGVVIPPFYQTGEGWISGAVEFDFVDGKRLWSRATHWADMDRAALIASAVTERAKEHHIPVDVTVKELRRRAGRSRSSPQRG